MSSYRPYYNAATFRSPSANLNDVDYFDGMERPWMHAVGHSVARFYAKQLASQPFEVAQFLLQVNSFENNRAYYQQEEDSDSDDEPDYFTNTDGTKIKTLRHRPTKIRELSHNMQLVPVDSPTPTAIVVRKPTIFPTLTAIIDKDGPVGLWRGINTSCLYTAATVITEAWISGFLSSLFGIPDAQFGDIMQANDPQLFLIIGAVASGLSHLIMSPIALIRARMLITTMKGSPRSLRSSLLNMSLCPAYAWAPQICSCVWSKLVELTTPWLLFQKLAVDEFRSPTQYGLLSLGVEVLSLVVKLPLDTFAHRAQVSALSIPQDQLIIDPVPYKGMLHSVLDILLMRVPLSTLYRGWRLELVRILSKWGYIALEQRAPIREKF